jgi:hypothetical protein
MRARSNPAYGDDILSTKRPQLHRAAEPQINTSASERSSPWASPAQGSLETRRGAQPVSVDESSSARRRRPASTFGATAPAGPSIV